MRRFRPFTALVAVVALVAPGMGAAGPNELVDNALPLLHSAVRPGTWSVAGDGSSALSAKTVDGAIGDWTGSATRFGGTALYSAGEYVYSDHLVDATGATNDTGGTIDSVPVTGPGLPVTLRDPLLGPPRRIPVEEAVEPIVPQTFRVESALTELGYNDQYGRAGYQARADIVELRVAADETNVYVLARTAAMTSANDTALVLLADTTPGAIARTVPFNAGIDTTSGDVAVLLANGAGVARDLSGATADTPVTVAVDSAGFTNAIEAAIPRALLERADGTLALAAATGLFDPATKALRNLNDNTGAPSRANLLNVAFRFDERIRVYYDQRQSLALYADSIDQFFAALDPAKMFAPGAPATGADQVLVPGPGYHDRIFLSGANISSEGGEDGVWQHYGLYLPSTYDGATPLPLTWWFHWRGGKAHTAAAKIPQFFHDMGEGVAIDTPLGEPAWKSIVVSPRGRGTSSWYLGKGQQDFLEVWADVFALAAIDEDRVYLSGHSMGGWASWLFPILYPDRFAASHPVSPPVTQGGYTGVDFGGCDSFRFQEYTPCFSGTNNSAPRIQWTRPLLENVRNVPISIYTGAADELVHVPGVQANADRLQQLGYRYRMYIYPTYEHYTPPFIDQWAEGARYFQKFVRDPNPARVTYKRNMPFERSVEWGPSQPNCIQGGCTASQTNLSFDFDRAYWMSGLTPADAVNGTAFIDARTLAKLDPSTAGAVPEAGGPAAPGQAGPYAMRGNGWGATPTGATSNGFTVTVTGTSSAQLDVTRMGLNVAAPIAGTVTNADVAFTLRLAGGWTSAPSVTVNGAPASASFSGGVLSVTLPAGSSAKSLVIG